MKSIVIIGGGFSGTITAINLARLSPVPLHITIVNKTPGPCRGIAYNTRNSSHLLNVVARNMSALADQPNHFVEWLSTRADYMEEPTASLRERFIPRRVYGEYIHNLFQSYSAVLAEEKGVQIDHIEDEASDILVTPDGHATVTLSNGKTLPADKVLLAVGNQTPVGFRLRGLDLNDVRHIGDPWLGWEKKLPAMDEDVLLVGTGLTMVDAFLSLKDLGWKGKIFATSRNGLLPLSHFKGFDYPDWMTEDLAKSPLRKLYSIFKKRYREARAQKINPAILVDKLRPYTQRIWQNFTLKEKKRFNRLWRTRWNVVRHRIAPEIHQQLQQGIANGTLEVIKGRLESCDSSDKKLKIRINTTGGQRTLEVGALINCTGPRESYLPSDSTLLNNLFQNGLVQPDTMNMGIQVTPGFAVVDRDGKTSATLFAMGAIIKGTLWETVAVPELRSQAFRIAETLAGQLVDPTTKKSEIEEVVQDVMEYSI